MESGKQGVIWHNEIGLSAMLRRERFVTDVAIPFRHVVPDGKNPTIIGWRALLDRGFRSSSASCSDIPRSRRTARTCLPSCDVDSAWTWANGREIDRAPGRIGRRRRMPLRLSRSRFRSAASRARASLRMRARHAALVVNPSAFSGRTGAPADFAAWLERGRGARFPDSWRMHPDLPLRTPARVGVIMHVHYTELLDEIVEQLEAIPVPFDLIVTNSSGRPIHVDQDRLAAASNVVVLDVENHGRDILPLVSLVNAGLLRPYQLTPQGPYQTQPLAC